MNTGRIPGIHFSYLIIQVSDDPNILSSRTLGAIAQVKFYRLTFLQFLKAGIFNTRGMEKHVIRTVCWSNKSKSLGTNQFLNRSLSHPKYSLRNKIWS